MFKKLLVATDGSTLAKKATDAALAMARSLNAELVVLRVVEPYPLNYFEGAMTVAPADVAAIEEKSLGKAQELVGSIKAAGEAAQVKTTGVTVKSTWIAENIIKTAKEQGCDLIVMASHGHKGLKRMLLGSQTLDVLTHSDIPVMVLR